MAVWSEYTLEVLKAAGWYPERRIDPEPFISVLREEGYEVSSAVVEFLSRFGGLTVTHRHQAADFAASRGWCTEDQFEFYASRLATHFPSDIRRDYERRIGRPVCLVGSCCGKRMLLFMSDDGAVYESYDDILNVVGRNAIESLNTICNNAPRAAVP